MYNNKLAVAVKSNGKVLREFGDTVYVPFGTEYTILLKNLNNVRALVDITVDGVDVGGGQSFVLPANGEVELERFLTNGNMFVGNRFKFIERTGAIEEHRGVGISDGLIRISYKFERVPIYTPLPVWRSMGSGGQLGGQGGIWTKGAGDYTGPYYATNATPDSYVAQGTSGQLMNCSVGEASATSINTSSVDVKNDVGITVPGSISEQKFESVSSFATEHTEHVMVIRLLGETEGKQVKKAVTVKAKPRCVSCGHQNKATAKFCSECGTSLQIV